MDRGSLAALVARHAKVDGVSKTPIEGLQLFRISEPIERLPGISPASMCCIVQGTKRAYLGGVAHTYDPEHYLCATMTLPVEAEVPRATRAEPVLGLLLDLDGRATAETLIAYEAAIRPDGPPQGEAMQPGLVVVKTDGPFTEHVARLLELLDEPVAQRVLADSRIRELLFTILEGPAGPLVRQTFGSGRDINRVIEHIRQHLGGPLSVDDLAKRAGMSRAVFHRRFKAATSFSPQQFVKALRLSHAAMQIVGGKAVGEAADAVGYVSSSQFSREFRRQFGAAPRDWVRTATSPTVGDHLRTGM